MRVFQSLPEGYIETFNVNLQKDKKKMLLINIFGTVLMIALAIPMHFYMPINSLFDMSQGIYIYFIRFIAIIILMIAYIILHEFIHGIAMKICGTKKVRYGFTGVYAYAGSDDYYSKRSYIFIALAPVVLLGIVIGIVNIFVPQDWFWVIYIIQVMNISGAVGDFYVTAKFSKMPKSILIRDSGVGMTVYSKE